MKRPPLLLSLKFGKKEKGHGFGLWIPLFIIGPVALIILLALFLIALPFMLISLVFTWHLGLWQRLIMGVAAFFDILHSLPGLKVDIEEGENIVYIAIC
jgi:hypothetical protein